MNGGGPGFIFWGVFVAFAVDVLYLIPVAVVYDREFVIRDLVEVDTLDEWKIGYGKRKLKELSEEMDTSINSTLTVERSSFASQLVPFRQGTGRRPEEISR